MLSSKSASSWFDFYNWLLAGSIALSFISTVGIVWTSRIKEDYSNQEISEAKERAAIAGLEAAKANKAAEDERLARVKIEERLAWRSVDPELYKRFVDRLSQYPNSKIQLWSVGNGDPESEAFTINLAELMQDAHWMVSVSLRNRTISPTPRGVICRINNDTEAGRSLADLFTNFSGTEIKPDPLGGGIIADITVGLKPPP